MSKGSMPSNDNHSPLDEALDDAEEMLSSRWSGVAAEARAAPMPNEFLQYCLGPSQAQLEQNTSNPLLVHRIDFPSASYMITTYGAIIWNVSVEKHLIH